MMDEKWVDQVLDNLGNNRAQVVRLKDPPCRNLGIINIYAPNNPMCNLWELLITKISQEYNQVLCGDSNMVEWWEDKLSTCGKLFFEKLEVVYQILPSKQPPS